MKIAAVFVALLLLMPMTALAAGTLTYGPNNQLCWQPPTSGPVPDGYRVKWGTATGIYSQIMDVTLLMASNAKCPAPGLSVKLGQLSPALTKGTYFFVATDYNGAGESGPSNEASGSFDPALTGPPSSAGSLVIQ